MKDLPRHSSGDQEFLAEYKSRASGIRLVSWVRKGLLGRLLLRVLHQSNSDNACAC